uniref:Fibronectin type-II domain-containing protein n=1 Tax=Chelonoidis abingdonii TaxID=106734 RepID=A0A8C0GUY4_CHEAB
MWIWASGLCGWLSYGGNSNGQRCTFPFVYKKQLFYTCTNSGDKMGHFWCLWSYCPDTSNVSSLLHMFSQLGK